MRILLPPSSSYTVGRADGGSRNVASSRDLQWPEPRGHERRAPRELERNGHRCGRTQLRVPKSANYPARVRKSHPRAEKRRHKLSPRGGTGGLVISRSVRSRQRRAPGGLKQGRLVVSTFRIARIRELHSAVPFGILGGEGRFVPAHMARCRGDRRVLNHSICSPVGLLNEGLT